MFQSRRSWPASKNAGWRCSRSRKKKAARMTTGTAAKGLRSSGYVVAQIGAGMHYAVPRILQEAGQLAHFYTDICASKSWLPVLKRVPAQWRPAALKRLLGREPRGIPADKITAF